MIKYLIKKGFVIISRKGSHVTLRYNNAFTTIPARIRLPFLDPSYLEQLPNGQQGLRFPGIFLTGQKVHVSFLHWLISTLPQVPLYKQDKRQKLTPGAGFEPTNA